MAATKPARDILQDLNEQQREAAQHGEGPLLIIAGAGTGKTKTLVHRVAHAIAQGVDPRRILLLTFTRRAAAEMLRRVETLLRQLGTRGGREAGKHVWGGTFHAIATRLLRMYGASIGLDPGFTIHDRGDSEDLLNVVRTDLGLAKTDKRFPKKGTCMAIYSRCLNARQKLERVLPAAFPWCLAYTEDLKRLFRGYVDRKEAAGVLDYDDLLLYWRELLAHQLSGPKIRGRFDCVLVDEYQDTNALQADILKLLRPDGEGLTAVGDDAQSIYSFRAATVRNILDFPKQFPGTTIIKLEQNYRSTQPILTVTNQVIAASSERYAKELWSKRRGGEKPWLVTCEDEDEQAEFVVEKILEHREAGLQLRQQAVLFRASHHSILLEAELARRNVPFVKYGGLKFIEAAHVKDLLAFLRLAENPADVVAGMRALVLLPGIGPARARELLDQLASGRYDFATWAEARVARSTQDYWPSFLTLMCHLAGAHAEPLPAQVSAVLAFYEPVLEEKYDNADSRLRDLEQLEHLSGRFRNRRTMLAELALDPPTSTADFAADASLDEDYLILSTIHSAKGLEWKAVYVIHASDGNIPSDMATKTPEEIEEERRLFYVALTRAKDWLYVSHAQRFYHAYRNRHRDDHGYAKRTRFITSAMEGHFCCSSPVSWSGEDEPETAGTARRYDRARESTRSLWM
jgi:DNA helicase-2/ATP-dependent DNA helicase PcrA